MRLDDDYYHGEVDDEYRVDDSDTFKPLPGRCRVKHRQVLQTRQLRDGHELALVHCLRCGESRWLAVADQRCGCRDRAVER
jgi:hypothetical protein